MANIIEHLVIGGTTYDLPTGGGGGGSTRTLLWTCPNYSSITSLASQTVTLADSVANYDRIGIYYCYRANSTVNKEIISYDETYVFDSNPRLRVMHAWTSVYIRQMDFTGTSASIGNCTTTANAGKTTYANDYCVPYKIFGIKD